MGRLHRHVCVFMRIRNQIIWRACVSLGVVVTASARGWAIACSRSQIATAYGYTGINFGTTAATGTGETIAIIDAYSNPNIASDLANFDGALGLAAPPKFTV